MSSEIKSPRVTRLSWGRLEIEDGSSFKDAKLFPGGARPWDWKETGTRHQPGIQPEDVNELLEHGSTVIILSRGIEGALQTCPETLDLLAKRGISTHILPTEEAVQLYNKLARKEAVGALIHSTC